MNERKRISLKDFSMRIKQIRTRPIDPKFIEEFNKVMEKDEELERKERERRQKQSARPPEVDT